MGFSSESAFDLRAEQDRINPELNQEQAEEPEEVEREAAPESLELDMPVEEEPSEAELL